MSEKTRQADFREDLLKRRVIYLEGDITHQMADEVGKMLVWLNTLGSGNITMYLDSTGGNVEAGLNIYDMIKHSGAPVTGIVYRKARSMAVLVLQACAERKIMKHANFRIHNVCNSITGEWHLLEENVKKAVADLKKLQQTINFILAERSGQTLEKINELCVAGNGLSPTEAKELGFVDEII